MLASSLVALDSAVLSTVVPDLTRDLGDFSRFPWVFSAYFLAQAVAIPVYGGLADVFGRRPVLLIGIALFLVGSAACAGAWNMTALIVFRGVQGLGAGAVQPVGLTIAGDIFSLTERARVQGYLGSVWAISALLGPVVAGVVTETMTWRVIFLINLPLGLAALALLMTGLPEVFPRRGRHIDVAGAATLAAGTAVGVLVLLEGGVNWPWISVTTAVLIAVSIMLLAYFVVLERRTAEPMFPFAVISKRVVFSSLISSFLVGALTIGLASYVPTYVRGVLGSSAVVGGLALSVMLVGWPFSSAISGRLYLARGFRASMTVGGVIAVVGAVMLATLNDSVALLALACLTIGIGLGFVNSPAMVAAQSTVATEVRGVVTSASMFARAMGSCVGVAGFGAVVNETTSSGSPGSSGRLNDISSDLLGSAIGTLFWAAVGITALLLVAAAVMPRHALQSALSAQEDGIHPI